MKIAEWIAPEYVRASIIQWEKATAEFDRVALLEKEVALRVNQRVADVLSTMDPFEPLLRKYHVIFSPEYPRPEDKLSAKSQYDFFVWAHFLEQDPNFKFLNDWIRNLQGNATVRQAKNSDEWFMGRAILATVTLYIREVSRLASRYKDIIAKRDGSFDAFLPVDE